MPVLDFTEIPIAAAGAGRDQFELFAREFLEYAGFRIAEGPDRGPDGGRDLVVEEVRTGPVGETHVRWLVSCKHKAHSGAAVTVDNEQDIQDRLIAHNCVGFIGFYSTVPSSGLTTKLAKLKTIRNASGPSFELKIYDPEKIEKQLLASSGLVLAKRFFPNSTAKWQKEHPSAAKIFGDDIDLLCMYCNKSLLQPEPRGIVVVWTAFSKGDRLHKEHTQRVYWCCKGQCDRALREQFRESDLIDGWEDIPDIVAPLGYIRLVMAMLNRLQNGMTYSPEAFDSTKKLLLSLFPLVSREMTTKEKDRIESLSAIPSYLGGWGYDT